MTKEDFLEGQLVLIDKPLNWTSFDIVNKIRYGLKKQFGLKKIKVGHAGTLDPLATGLVLVCTGKMTKQIESFMGMPKVYTGTIALGATTPSYDLETEPDQTFPTEHITEDALRDTAKSFEGEIWQKPPIFSAIKKDGVRAYKAARKGEDIELPSRKVQIEYFKITQISMPQVHFEVKCSKGTYIRSLAHDFGQNLHSGSHLSALRRENIGEYQVSDGKLPLEFLESISLND